MHMLIDNIEDNGCRKRPDWTYTTNNKYRENIDPLMIDDEVVRIMKKALNLFGGSMRNPLHYSIFQRRNMICIITRNRIWSWRMYIVGYVT